MNFAADAVLLRFADPHVFGLVADALGDWLFLATAVIVQFPATKLRGWRPAEVGLTEQHAFTNPNGREITFLPGRPERVLQATQRSSEALDGFLIG